MCTVCLDSLTGDAYKLSTNSGNTVSPVGHCKMGIAKSSLDSLPSFNNF